MLHIHFFHLITQPVPLSFFTYETHEYQGSYRTQVGSHSQLVTKPAFDPLSDPFHLTCLPYHNLYFQSWQPQKILQAYLHIKIICSWRKKQGGWLKPMLIYLGRLFTRLFKELSDSANFNQVIVKQSCIPPCKAKYKYKCMTQHKPAVALSTSHYPHSKRDE